MEAGETWLGELEREAQTSSLRCAHVLVMEQLIFESALREVYGNDPQAYLTEDGGRPRLAAWCAGRGLDPAWVERLLRQGLAPLFPGFTGLEPIVYSNEDMGALGATLADMELSSFGPAQFDIVMPGVAGMLVGSLPRDDGDQRWPEERLVELGDRHPLVEALLRGYDRALLGQPARAVNRQDSLWMQLARGLRAYRTRRTAGFAVEPLMSPGLRVDAAAYDNELLAELGWVVVEHGAVVKNATELDVLVAKARERLGREPEARPKPTPPSLKKLLRVGEAVAEELDALVAPLGLEALVVLRPRGQEPPAVRVVLVEAPEPVGDGELEEAGGLGGDEGGALFGAPGAAPAPQTFRLPRRCGRCCWAPRLRAVFSDFQVALARELTNIPTRDGPSAVPL